MWFRGRGQMYSCAKFEANLIFSAGVAVHLEMNIVNQNNMKV